MYDSTKKIQYKIVATTHADDTEDDVAPQLKENTIKYFEKIKIHS